MGSPCEVLCEGLDKAQSRPLLEIATREAWRIEDKFSRYLGDNVTARINEADGKPVSVDAETAQLLDFANTLYELSDGLFDITSGILRKAWRFDGSDKVPQQSEIDVLLENVGWNKVEWANSKIHMPAGMEIDLGGIGKEYAVDRAAELLRNLDATPCLINFGGDLAVTAAPKLRESWRVGIESPSGAAERQIDLQSGAIATSGDTRRFLLRDGVRYGHVLNPQTGWPVEEAPRSVTVAADTCTQAGIISILAVLRGDGAESFLQQQDEQSWIVR
ncbi:MAG: FAD:protein FMN transferase [Gammaproteobacteria bacterium]|nr:FAD:protein FMN transferase [Gammaproteobacteria bacterium]